MAFHQQPDEHPVLGVVTLLLPEPPHLVDPRGNLSVAEGFGLVQRNVVEFERIRVLGPATALDGGQDALAVVVRVEGVHGAAQLSRRRVRCTWSSSRATSDCESVAPVCADKVSGISAST